MWNHVHASAIGTSHAKTGKPCQDASRVALAGTANGPVLVLVCSDGAGSASLSEIGSHLACEEFVRGATEWLALGAGPEALTEPVAQEMCVRIREALHERASQFAVTPRDLACTLIAAIVSETSAAFVQVGDGGIVIREHTATLRPVFWPASGEYINTTFFLTDPNLPDRVQFASLSANVRDIALFTDGLQMLCLRYADRVAHEPFFRPLFHSLRSSAEGLELTAQLETFLNSGPINSRTDDDKTLILATRPHLALAAPSM
jgi:hypothetical protein